MADIETKKPVPLPETGKDDSREKKDSPDRREEVAETARNELQNLRTDIPVEQITDEKILENVLSMKIRDYPKSVPAYLDMIVEKNPKLLDTPTASALLAQKIQELLTLVATKPELSQDRDWMDSLRKSINRLIINPDLAARISQFGTMDATMRKELQRDLGISEKITE